MNRSSLSPARSHFVFAATLTACAFGVRGAHAQTSEPRQASAAIEPPSAAAVAEARARFNRGLALYKDGDLPSALAELRRADALAPSYRLKYNIAQVCEEQHDYSCALSAFRAYLDGGGSEIPRARRTSVEAELKKVAPLVAELHIRVDDPGAEISIDDVVVGTAPLADAVEVNSGVRRVSARHGALVATRSVEVAGGEQLDVSLALGPAIAEPTAPLAGAARATPTTVPATAARANARPIVWIGWAGAGAFAAGSAIAGAIALHASHELADERGTYPVTSAELSNTSDRASHWALAADVLGVLALASAGTALYFTFTPETEGAHASGGTVSLRARF